MAYRVVLLPSAALELSAISAQVQWHVKEAISALAADPRLRGAKLLAGADDIWRVRGGDYRILYRINDDLLEVLVIRIRQAGDAYR